MIGGMGSAHSLTAAGNPVTALQCAIYTRTSVPDREDSKFTSNQGQNEACAALISSRRNEHWVKIEHTYDDQGWSGKDLERPALKLLLSDIERGQVQKVVVHRLDRLSRRLTDISKLSTFFDEHGVTLVSVTQQIDSDTPLGRLTLNTLISFAQFEREIAGERTRDKIAASRRKGMWQSAPPLGYDVRDQYLVINAAEAAMVKHIFLRFVELASASVLAKELSAQAVTTKAWNTQTGNPRGGRPIDKNYLYKLLNNRMFIGDVLSAGQWHPGRHEAIISREVWDEVHALIGRRTRAAHPKPSEPFEFLLRGRVFGQDGRAYTPWRSSLRKSRVYRYYVPQRDISVGAGASGLPRYSAYALENLVMECLRETLRNPSELIEGLPESLKSQPDYNEADLVTALSCLDSSWDKLWPGLQKTITLQFVQKVIIGPDDFVLNIDVDGVMQWIREFHQVHQSESSPDNSL